MFHFPQLTHIVVEFTLTLIPPSETPNTPVKQEIIIKEVKRFLHFFMYLP